MILCEIVHDFMCRILGLEVKQKQDNNKNRTHKSCIEQGIVKLPLERDSNQRRTKIQIPITLAKFPANTSFVPNYERMKQLSFSSFESNHRKKRN